MRYIFLAVLILSCDKPNHPIDTYPSKKPTLETMLISEQLKYQGSRLDKFENKLDDLVEQTQIMSQTIETLSKSDSEHTSRILEQDFAIRQIRSEAQIIENNLREDIKSCQVTPDASKDTVEYFIPEDSLGQDASKEEEEEKVEFNL